MRDVAFDTETGLIAPGRLAPPLVCMSAFDGRKTHLLDPQGAVIQFEGYLDNPEIRLVGQNVSYDLGVMTQHAPELLPKIWRALDDGRIVDTMIAEQLAMIRIGRLGFDYNVEGKANKQDYTLAGLAKKHLGETMEGKTGADAWRYRYHELLGKPIPEWPEAASEYAKEDARSTWRVWSKQREAYGELATLPFQASAAFALHLFGAWGLRTAPDAVAECEARWNAAVRAAKDGGELDSDVFEFKDQAREDRVRAAARRGLRALGLVRDDGSRNMVAICTAVEEAYKAKGMRPPRTATGKPSTSAETLLDSEDAGLELLAAISGVEKLISTYLPILRAGTLGPINPRFRVLVESGRTSCSNPNVQNQPRSGGVRECYAARPGYVYVACDWSTAELRALAQVLLDTYGYSEMAEALRAGRDLHLVTAAEIMGCTYEEAVRRYKAGDKAADDARQLAKAANFGFCGGLGAAAFCAFAKASYGLLISEEQARELKNAWLRAYPEMREYFRDVGEAVEASGGAWTLEMPRTGYVRGGLGYTDGCNHPFQHLVAHAGKAACIQVAKECWGVGGETGLTHARPVAFVHDEIILEVPEDLVDVAAKRLRAVMLDALGALLPDVPVEAEAVAMRRWRKGAKPAYNDNRELIPWEDRKCV